MSFLSDNAKKRILMLGNSELVIFGFRNELIEALMKLGYQVITAYPKTVFGDGSAAVSAGCEYIETHIEPHGKNPFEDLQLIGEFRQVIRETRADLVLSYTIKPNIYGSFAAKMEKVPYISNITGLGNAMVTHGFLRTLTLIMYRLASSKAERIFFQNDANEQLFYKKHIARGRHTVVSGSGVNLLKFSRSDYPPSDEGYRLLFLGRVMRDKGVSELLEAAQILKKTHPEVHIALAGNLEDSEYGPILDNLSRDGIIDYFGRMNNVSSLIEQCHAIILPSYHEGMANSLLEGASCARPLLVSDIPGCRETCEDGVTGFTFASHSSEAIVSAVERFLALSDIKKKEMGLAGRVKMENTFDRRGVVDIYIKEIEKVLNK